MREVPLFPSHQCQSITKQIEEESQSSTPEQEISHWFAGCRFSFGTLISEELNLMIPLLRSLLAFLYVDLWML